MLRVVSEWCGVRQTVCLCIMEATIAKIVLSMVNRQKDAQEEDRERKSQKRKLRLSSINAHIPRVSKPKT